MPGIEDDSEREAPAIDLPTLIHRLPVRAVGLGRRSVLLAPDPTPGSFRYRAGGIRTHDLLNPIQAHYQAVLRPDCFSENAKDAKARDHCNRNIRNVQKQREVIRSFAFPAARPIVDRRGRRGRAWHDKNHQSPLTSHIRHGRGGVI